MSEQLERTLKAVGELPIPLAELLDGVRNFIARFCVFPSEHCLVAVTLWAAHTHIIKHLYATPRLALLSPEAASGKTRVLEVLDMLVPESLFTLNASPAAIFRLLAQEQITLLFDEVDAIWSKRGKDDNHEDLRALLNAGYKRGASIPRCVGPKHEVTRFDVYCAVALAGLGNLPETIMSRSIIIRMRRRAPGEKVEPLRTRIHEIEGHAFRAKLESWSKTVDVADQFPEMPDGIVDRPAEVWEPLLIVADMAGGEWPRLARDACSALCLVAEDRRASLGVRLLADLRTVFGQDKAMHTQTVLQKLTGEVHEPEETRRLDDDAPWADLRGKPLGKRGLASMLRQYGVHPQKVTINGSSLQGYRYEHLWDAWVRYLPSLTPEQTELPEFCGVEPGSADTGIPEIPDIRTPERAYPECENVTNEEARL